MDTTLHPVHKSLLNRNLTPNKMSRMEITDDQRVFIESQALSIFADCTNVGTSFNEALVAILMSGMNWGMEVSKETK